MDKVLKHKQLELQLSEAKMAQQGLQHNEEKEKSLLEKQQVRHVWLFIISTTIISTLYDQSFIIS